MNISFTTVKFLATEYTQNHTSLGDDGGTGLKLLALRLV